MISGDKIWTGFETELLCDPPLVRTFIATSFWSQLLNKMTSAVCKRTEFLLYTKFVDWGFPESLRVSQVPPTAELWKRLE